MPPSETQPQPEPTSSPLPPHIDSLPNGQWSTVARAIRGIFSDIDDTLTEHGRLVPAAYAALTEARAAGLRLVLVTGRPLAWAEVLTAIFPVDAAVAENGAVAALPGGRRLYFEDVEARRAGALRREAAREQIAREHPEVKLAGDQPQRDVDLAYDIAETARLSEPDVARLTSILQSHGLRTTRSSIHLHGTYSAGDKAKMSALVGEVLWREEPRQIAADYLFVGDSPNDAPAFAFFSRSVGVANVLAFAEELTQRGCMPWAVTRSPSGRGFAELVGAVLRAREANGDGA